MKLGKACKLEIRFTVEENDDGCDDDEDDK
jgi:hypothetical protein